MSTTYKIKCKCNHTFQDTTYGTGVRIATPTTRTPSPSTIEVRCTVCGSSQVVNK